MPCSQFSEKVKKHINVIVPLACLSSLIQTKDCQPPEIKKKLIIIVEIVLKNDLSFVNCVMPNRTKLNNLKIKSFAR